MSAPHLVALLARLAQGPASAADLAAAAGVSQPTISRALAPLQGSGRVLRLGGPRRGARYALTRELEGLGTTWPVYRVDATGTPQEAGQLHAIERERFAVRGGPARIAGVFESLPYWLEDARPVGYLGRAIPTAHPELRLPARVQQDWTQTHFLSWLTRWGIDIAGDLLVGRDAVDRYLAGATGAAPVPADDRVARYGELADAALAGTPAGSSVHGEHPKFAARLIDGTASTSVLVKFSPRDDSPASERWRDLLVAEQIAARLLADNGVASARTELIAGGGRHFLQSERFDRRGERGRIGVCSLHAIDTERYGRLDRWSLAAERLHADGLLSERDVATLRLLEAFGMLIANTDRHFGNVALFDRFEGPFELAPSYDMLPMLFAPQDGQLIEREFEAPAPTAATLRAWEQARAMALGYWETVGGDARISESFRAIGARAHEALRAA